MTELDAVLRLMAGDTGGLDPLYAAYAQGAVRTAYLITRDQAAAEDVVQESFIQVLRRVGSLRDPASFRPWFYRILVNAARRAARGPARALLALDLAQHDHADPTVPGPDENVLHREETQAVRTAISELNDVHRIPLILRYYSRLSDMEIAQALDLPVGTVKSRLYNARRALQTQLDKKPVRPLVGAPAVQKG